MATTPVNQLPYPDSSDDSDISAVGTLGAAIDDLLLPRLTRTQVASQYSSPDDGALWYNTTDKKLALRENGVWRSAFYKYVPLTPGSTYNSSDTDYVYVPGASFEVYSGEKYVFQFHIVFFLDDVGNTIEFAWDAPAMTSSSWIMRRTTGIAAETSESISTPKVNDTDNLGNLFVNGNGYLQPSANGTIALKFRKDLNADPATPTNVFVGPPGGSNAIGSSYIRYAKLA